MATFVGIKGNSIQFLNMDHVESVIIRKDRSRKLDDGSYRKKATIRFVDGSQLTISNKDKVQMLSDWLESGSTAVLTKPETVDNDSGEITD